MASTIQSPANTLLTEHGQEPSTQHGSTAVSAPTPAGPRAGLLMTVEQVAVLWFGEVGEHGSASANCQKIRRLIPDVLPARRSSISADKDYRRTGCSRTCDCGSNRH